MEDSSLSRWPAQEREDREREEGGLKQREHTGKDSEYHTAHSTAERCHVIMMQYVIMM